MRLMGFTWCNGWAAITKGVVEQLGMDMIPWCQSTSAPFTSGTTKGTVSSMRKAEPSSITTAPAATAAGASLWLTSELADMNATSTPSKDFAVASSTTKSFPPTLICFPADRLEASNFSLGKVG